MKKAEKSIELDYSMMFNLERRRKINNLTDISIFGNGVLIDQNVISKKNADYNELDEESESLLVLECDNNILTITDKLGEYVYNHDDLLKNLAMCYVKNSNVERYVYIKKLRPNDSIDFKPLKLKKNEFDNIDVDEINKIDYSDEKYMVFKYAEKKRLLKLIKKWYEICGLSELEFHNLVLDKQTYNELENYSSDGLSKGLLDVTIFKSVAKKDDKIIRLIPLPYLLHLLDFCLTVYRLNNNKYENSFEKEIPIYYVANFNHEKVITTRHFKNLKDFVYFCMAVSNQSDNRHLCTCQRCGDLIFGKIGRKYCPKCREKTRNEKKRKKRLEQLKSK